MGNYETIDSVLKAYWQGELGLTNAAMILLTDFDTKIVTLEEIGAHLFDMENQEHLTILRNKATPDVMFERKFELELKSWPTEESEAALRVAVDSIVERASMGHYEIDLENSRFSIRVDHLAFLAESGDIDVD